MQTFKPSFSTYRKYVFSILPIAIALLLFFIILYSQDNLVRFLLILLAAVALVVLYLVLFFRNTRIEVDHHSLVQRGAFGRTRTAADHQLGTAVLALSYEQSAGYSTVELSRLFVLDSVGKRVLSWTSATWTLDQMKALTASLGLGVDEITGPITSRAFRERYPHALSFAEARPWAMAWIIVGALLVIGVIIVVIVLASSD